MKKFFMYIFFFICSFFCLIGNADATALSNKTYTLECIYSDGSLFSYEYSIPNNNYIMNRISYDLVGANAHEATTSGDIVYVNNLITDAGIFWGNYIIIPEMQVLTCPATVYSALYHDKVWYKFRSDFECEDDSCDDLEATNSGWCQFVGCKSDDFAAAEDATKNAIEGTLVSERYILGDNVSTPNITLYYMMPSEQAAGVNAYIKIMIYDNVVLLEKDGRVTQVKEGADAFSNITKGASVTTPSGYVLEYTYSGLTEEMETIYINSPEPIPSTSSSSTLSYYFNAGQIRYGIAIGENNSTDVYSKKYVLTEDVPDSALIDYDLCNERLRNTSPIIKDLIKYSQIFLPIIVIVITSIDIARVVIAGNIEEELPKKKKMIIHRLIMIVVFFFLPLIVRLFISLIKDSGIGENNEISDSIEYIDCLFR